MRAFHYPGDRHRPAAAGPFPVCPRPFAAAAIGAAGVLAVLLASVPARAERIPLDGFVAGVNERVITGGDVLAAMRPVERQLRARYQDEELDEKLQQAFENTRDALVEQALILEEFKRLESAETRQIGLPEQAVEDRISDIVDDQFGGDRARLLAELAREQITYSEWKTMIREQLIVMLLRRQEVDAKVSISPRAVYEVYESNLDEYFEPAQVNVSIITLLKGETPEETDIKRQEAQSVLDKLNAGKDFGDLAQAVSEGSRADKQGHWGWTQPEVFNRTVAEAVQDLEAGDVSGVLEGESAFYLVKVWERRAERTVPFEEVRERIERRLRSEEERRLYREWIARLMDRHYVRIFE